MKKLLDHVGSKLGKATYGSFLYPYALSGATDKQANITPPVFAPQSLQNADRGRGQWLCSGVMEYHGLRAVLAPFEGGDSGAPNFGSMSAEARAEYFASVWGAKSLLSFDPSGAPLKPDHQQAMAAYAHGFEWLADLRALGTDMARMTGRHLIRGWLQHFGYWDDAAWRIDIASKRLNSWLHHYDYFIAAAPDHLIDKTSLTMARHIHHFMTVPSHHIVKEGAALETAKAMILGASALPHAQHAKQTGLELLEQTLKADLLNDGGHWTRSPQKLSWTLQLCLEIQYALRQAREDVPRFLDFAVQKMQKALHFFLMRDGRFALFQNTQEGHAGHLEKLVRASNTPSKRPSTVSASLHESGYEKMVKGKMSVMLDAGVMPDKQALKHAGSQHLTHASLGAIIAYYDKEAVFTSCGSHPYDTEWQQALRGSAAHSLLTVDHRDVAHLDEDGSASYTLASNPELKREDDLYGGLLCTLSHGAYEASLGLTHIRRLHLDKEGLNFRGEDILMSEAAIHSATAFTIRFHLHPRAQSSLTEAGRVVLIKLGSGAGLRFAISGDAQMTLEPGVYLGRGNTPRQTQQIVLSGRYSGGIETIGWALQKL
jgi:uncharacterized heparinase superfamily protein